MHYFIELWSAKDTWIAMSQEERGNYLNQIGPHIGNLVENGAEIITWSINSNDTPQKSKYQYIAIWRFPNEEMVKSFENLVQGAGWYNYFEQDNVSGSASTVNDVLGMMINL